jgi:hypothetical protein
MEGGKRRTGPVRRVERSFECSRLAEQLLISAYERVVPVIRHALRRDPPSVQSTLAAAETAAPSSRVAARL